MHLALVASTSSFYESLYSLFRRTFQKKMPPLIQNDIAETVTMSDPKVRSVLVSVAHGPHILLELNASQRYFPE